MATGNFKMSQEGFPTFTCIIDTQDVYETSREDVLEYIGDDIEDYTFDEIEEMIENDMDTTVEYLYEQESERTIELIEDYTDKIADALTDLSIEKIKEKNIYKYTEDDDIDLYRQDLKYYIEKIIDFNMESGYYEGFSVTFALDETDFIYEIESTLDVELGNQLEEELLKDMYELVNVFLDEFYEEAKEDGLSLMRTERISTDSTGNSYYHREN